MKLAVLGVMALAAPASVRADGDADAALHRATGREQYKMATTRDELVLACAEFEASLAIEEDAGTLQRLAVCYQKLGRLGTAWRMFEAAQRSAHALGFTELEGYARDNLAALRPARIVIVVPRPDIVVTLDGERVEPEARGDAGLPVDAGSHHIRAAADGFQPFERTLEAIDAVAATVVVELVPIPVPVAVPRAAQVAPDRSSRRVAGWITLGASALVGVTGLSFGYRAWSSYRDADAACPTHRGCDAATLALDGRAGRAAIIADVALGLAVVGCGIGTYLVLTGKRGAHVAPLAGDGTIGLALGAGF
jgi:hypothetical protein